MTGERRVVAETRFWRTPVGAALIAFALLGLTLLVACVVMVEHLHFWLILPYLLLAVFPVIALVVYAAQLQRERGRYRPHDDRDDRRG